MARRRGSARDQPHAPSSDAAGAGSGNESFSNDPDRLIEDAFRDRNPADAPDTYVLAWLALLGAPDDAPRAAAELTTRLLQNHSGGLSFWQARLIELLAFVAQHTRSPSSATSQSLHSLSKKGTS